MIRIAVIEDENKEAELLKSYLVKYESECSENFSVSCFPDAVDFLTDYHAEFDIIFMDIELPHMSGIEAAKKLRLLDPVVALVFITNMEQLAVRGYEVDAIDFVVKPINYYRFSSMLKKAVRAVKKNDEKEVVVRTAATIKRLRISQIYYIEVRDHRLIYHTEVGIIEAWGNLKDTEDMLTDSDFARSSSAYLVNLKHVVSIDSDCVTVGDDSVPISQRRKKSFYDSVNKYLGGNK